MLERRGAGFYIDKSSKNPKLRETFLIFKFFSGSSLALVLPKIGPQVNFVFLHLLLTTVN